MNLVTLILDNWRVVLIAMVIASVGMLYGWGSHHKNRAERLEWKIAEMERIADEFQQESDRIARATNEQIPKLVEQAKEDAYRNYLKKYGNNAACGIRHNGLPTDNSAGQTDRSERTDEPSQSEFVVACATDAGIIEQWRNWAIANQLPVQ